MILRGDIFGSFITLLEAASRGSLSSLADKEKPPALPMTFDRLLITVSRNLVLEASGIGIL